MPVAGCHFKIHRVPRCALLARAVVSLPRSGRGCFSRTPRPAAGRIRTASLQADRRVSGDFFVPGRPIGPGAASRRVRAAAHRNSRESVLIGKAPDPCQLPIVQCSHAPPGGGPRAHADANETCSGPRPRPHPPSPSTSGGRPCAARCEAANEARGQRHLRQLECGGRSVDSPMRLPRSSALARDGPARSAAHTPWPPRTQLGAVCAP